MAGTWLVDSKRIATKIKSASVTSCVERVEWKSNPSKACPNCHHVIDNSDVVQEWPGLPRGVKFDPSDQEIIWHLLAKVGVGGLKPHPFIREFIPTVDNNDGICYTHPQNLPGVRQDGSMSHFFHRAIKAYNTGTRKRRKIQGDDFGDVRWHKTGRTKPVILDGVQKGCKKIMVLYMSTIRGGKSEKTNWVMHQYHLGTGEDERDGEYVISKIFYQQQQTNKGDKAEEDLVENIDDAMVAKVDPVTPKSLTPDPPRAERRCSNFDMGQESSNICTDPHSQHPEVEYVEKVRLECETPNDNFQPKENPVSQIADDNDDDNCVELEHGEEEVPLECEMPCYNDQPKAENHVNQMGNDNDNCAEEDSKWWDSESQNLLDSQQLVEGLSLCDEFLQSQSPNRDGYGTAQANDKPLLSVYAQLGPECFKKDLEECQNPVLDDTPPEFRLSQLDFGSQESFIAWGGGKVTD